MVTVTKFARIVAQQSNPNVTQRNSWHDLNNAIGKTDQRAYSSYTKKKVVTKDKKGNVVKKEIVYNHPWKLTANDFGFEIPDYAYINSITVGIRAELDVNPSGTPPIFPFIGFYIADRKAGVKDKKINEGGWKDGIYWANSTTPLTTTLTTAEYKMSGDNFRKGKYTIDDLNSSYFGVDIDWYTGKYDDCHVKVKWIWVKIDYDIPEYELYHDVKNNTQSNPLEMIAGTGKFITYTLKQKTNANGGTHTLWLHVPWGSEARDVVAKNSTVQYDPIGGFYKWTVNCNGKTTATLDFTLMDYTVNSQIVAVHDITNEFLTNKIPVPQSRYLYYHTVRGGSIDGYGEMEIAYNNEEASPHKRHPCCFAITGIHESDDSSLTYYISDTVARDVVSVELTEGTSSGVSIISDGLDHTRESTFYNENVQMPVVFKVPPNNERFRIELNICYRPHSSGDATLTVLNGDTGASTGVDYDYYIEDPYSYHIGTKFNDTDTEWHEGFSGEIIRHTSHRIASNLETGAFVLPCGVKPVDSLMIQDKPHIRMYKWEEIDYIGCVPVEHYHFDPKSTYKDTLLNTSYKNNRFMGKQLTPDEDISLNIRLHPAQVTTIQGLIDMDKPIPINANHKCFEGDSLNHRGWAEIYSIKSEKTNPHWYKCDIDVKYLTHNLNTRFKIKKGDRTFNDAIPSLLSEINGSGEEINSNFFAVDTDGSYAYIEDITEVDDFYDGAGETITWLGYDVEHTFTDFDENEVTLTGEYLLTWIEEMGEEYKEPILNQTIKIVERYNTDKTLKNKFTLDEGQHISIQTREPVSTINQITFSWLSTRLIEEKENNISRVIRLINAETGDIVFEYEYCDFDFSSYQEYTDAVDSSLTGILSCRVIGRVKNKNDYDVPINHMINLAVDVETSTNVTDPNMSEGLANLQYFGSTLHFRLNNRTLTVVDEGYNGKELERTVELIEGNQYKWETYWVNKNTDGEDNDINSYLDIVVQNSILESQYQDNYRNMYVSPFPVQDKKILFTRQAEEGVIYYLKDDSEEFSYLLEPYYIYHNGVDLRNEVGSSIFNLNYGYKTIYLENGLVSLGINRLNGRMFLRRYDNYLRQYVTLFNLELSKYDDININSISDDRIELQASDSTIIMYRGHPYVIIRHPTEDINITSKSYQVWGQCIDGVPSEFPVMFDLMNKDNLLPECVTKKLDDDCVSVTEHEVTGLTSVTLTLTKDDTEEFIFEGNSLDFAVSGQPTGSKVCFLIKKIDPKENTLQGYDEVGCSTDGTFNYKFEESGAFNVIAVYVGDDTYEYAISEPVSVNVNAKLTDDEQHIIDPTGDKPESELSGDYVLTINSPSVFTYRDNQKITYTLTKGGIPISGHELQVVDFTHMNTETLKNGKVSVTNRYADTHPKKYKIGARFIVTGQSRAVKKVYKDVEVKKAKPVFHVSGAGSLNGKFTCKLLHELPDGTKYELANRKITVYINGKKNEVTTNKKGNCSFKITEKGTYKYKCTFGGDKDYESCTAKYRESVK